MNIDIQNLKNNLKNNFKLTALVVVFGTGVVFDFFGLIIAQSAMPAISPNPLGLPWFWLFFYLYWVVAVVLVIALDALKMYRFLLLALTTLLVAFIPLDLQYSLNLTVSFGAAASGGGLKVAGLIFQIFPALLAMILFGAEEDSFVHSDVSFADVSLSNVSLPRFGKKENQNEMSEIQFQARMPSEQTLEENNAPLNSAPPNSAAQGFPSPYTPMSVGAPAPITMAPPPNQAREVTSSAVSTTFVRNSFLPRPQTLVLFRAKAMYGCMYRYSNSSR
jgi:hypothetical protein